MFMPATFSGANGHQAYDAQSSERQPRRVPNVQQDRALCQRHHVYGDEMSPFSPMTLVRTSHRDADNCPSTVSVLFSADSGCSVSAPRLCKPVYCVGRLCFRGSAGRSKLCFCCLGRLLRKYKTFVRF